MSEGKRSYRVRAEWVIDDRETAWRLAETLQVLGAKNVAWTPKGDLFLGELNESQVPTEDYAMTPEQAMAEKRAYLHRVAVEEADKDYADSGSLSEDEETERSGRPR